MRFGWLFLLALPLLAEETEEEALFLRRIAEFWQEKEYSIAKSQMEEFIVQFPESTYADVLSAALGDLYLSEKNFSGALSHYSQIRSPEFSERIFLNRMQCLYEMQWYANLADECEAYLEKKQDLHVTYFLAIALYHQCLNATKDPETLLRLAERAKPYFEILSKSELSDEVAQGFAHLCCIVRDFPKASQLYLDLAKKNPEIEEDMLFQAALIQSEFNKELALQTFDQIVKLGKKRSKEASYNQLVLSFELGRELKQVRFEEIPAERAGMAHLFLGRSLLNQKKYAEAIEEFKIYLQDANPSETLHAAVLSLLDAAYHCNDLATLDQALAKLTELYPQDSELPKAYFSRAQVLKKNQKTSEAHKQIEELLARFPQFEQKPQAIFELTHLDYQTKAWDSCYLRARAFLTQFPQHQLAPFAWRYLVSASVEIASVNPPFREQLLTDLEAILKQPLPDTEKQEWEFLLAKTHYDLGHFEPAIALLQKQNSPNATLLLALCYRDGLNKPDKFCELAEFALEKGANLADAGQMHISLFNAYLQLSQPEKAADHLYTAFESKADIKIENLLWLADAYYTRLLNEESNFPLATKTALVLEKIKRKTIQCKAALHDSGAPKEASSLGLCIAALHEMIDSQVVVCKLAKVYSLLGRVDEEITLLEKLESPGPEAQLLLAEGYAKKGIIAKAAALFDTIVSDSPTVRSAVSASAALQSTRLKRKEKNANLVQIATQLKNLVVQKTFVNEPIHLEAALDYVDLQAKGDAVKKMALLKKTKYDFERSDDLLSKDYQEARSHFPEKDKVYQGYMRFIDAEILAAEAKLVKDREKQKELLAKSKDLLLQIVNEPTANALHERAKKLLCHEQT